MGFLKRFTIILLVTLIPSYSFSSPSLDKRLTSFIKDFYGDEAISVKFLNLSLSQEEKMRLVDIRFSKIPDMDGNGILSLEWENGRKLKKKTFVSFKVSRKGKLFLAKKEMKRGDIVSEKDLEIKEVVMDRWDEKYPSNLNEIIGKKINRKLAEGSVIARNMLEEQVSVKHGEIVTLIYENGRLLIQTKGKVLERGRIGDIVKVENISSGKKITGRVVGEKKIKVEL